MAEGIECIRLHSLRPLGFDLFFVKIRKRDSASFPARHSDHNFWVCVCQIHVPVLVESVSLVAVQVL